MQKLKQKNGIQIDLISSQKMAELTTMEKIRMILDGGLRPIYLLIKVEPPTVD